MKTFRGAGTAAAALGLWSLFGCDGQPPSYDDVVAGRVELAAGDREAFERLVGPALSPAQIRLYGAGEKLGSVPSVRVEDGRVTGIKLNQVDDASSLAQLEMLRQVRLAGTYSTVLLSGSDSLEELDLISRERSLRTLELFRAAEPQCLGRVTRCPSPRRAARATRPGRQRCRGSAARLWSEA